MKLFWIGSAAAVLACAGAHAAEGVPVRAVCMQNRGLLNTLVVLRAQAVVTTVFAEAGVKIEWQSSRQCRDAGDDVLRVAMDAEAPASFGPETMAYALPYGESRTAIHVFYNRIVQDHRDLDSEVLGHVMAHEIGHVLEGIARHSPGGVMKAHWTHQDYSDMSRPHLSFAPEDVELIHVNLRRLSTVSAARFTARAERE